MTNMTEAEFIDRYLSPTERGNLFAIQCAKAAHRRGEIINSPNDISERCHDGNRAPDPAEPDRDH